MREYNQSLKTEEYLITNLISLFQRLLVEENILNLKKKIASKDTARPTTQIQITDSFLLQLFEKNRESCYLYYLQTVQNFEQGHIESEFIILITIIFKNC